VSYQGRSGRKEKGNDRSVIYHLDEKSSERGLKKKEGTRKHEKKIFKSLDISPCVGGKTLVETEERGKGEFGRVSYDCILCRKLELLKRECVRLAGRRPLRKERKLEQSGNFKRLEDGRGKSIEEKRFTGAGFQPQDSQEGVTCRKR